MNRWKPPAEKSRPGALSISFDADVLDEIASEAERQGRRVSWIVQRAWKVARAQIREMPVPPEVK